MMQGKTVKGKGKTMSIYQHKILDASEIDRILTRITHEILEKHRGTENLAFIGIQTRGVYLAKRIRSEIHKIEGVRIPTGDMDITLYRDDWTRISHNPIVQTTEIAFSVDGKQIILVDDVLFTGRTIRAALDALIDFGRPDRIELAVLVDRGHRELPIQADYAGKFVETRRSETVNVLLSEHDGADEVVIEKLKD
ncbi:bifunctional pyr operon transcriptional regulator/uracil phosphoribosyltransferase PyrR [Desulfobacterales bacterium HSG2]|nr:bifunctional pyr operon transcriptional regulator/uracil phosphoribosyltransferase PyrR [Desulfobacterales bacterium HSG2]